mgnify:FL=1
MIKRFLTAIVFSLKSTLVVSSGFCLNERSQEFQSDCDRMDHVGHFCEGFFAVYLLGVLLLMSLLGVIYVIRRR